MGKDDRPFKSIEELAIKTPSDSDIGVIGPRIMGCLIKRELKKHGYQVKKDLENDLFCDFAEEMSDAIFGDYPNAIFSSSKEFNHNIIFYFKKTPDVTTDERWAVGLSKEWMEKIE